MISHEHEEVRRFVYVVWVHVFSAPGWVSCPVRAAIRVVVWSCIEVVKLF